MTWHGLILHVLLGLWWYWGVLVLFYRHHPTWKIIRLQVESTSLFGLLGWCLLFLTHKSLNLQINIVLARNMIEKRGSLSGNYHTMVEYSLILNNNFKLYNKRDQSSHRIFGLRNNNLAPYLCMELCPCMLLHIPHAKHWLFLIRTKVSNLSELKNH